MRKIVGMIQAKEWSGPERFPGKAFYPLAGKPALWHCAQRLLRLCDDLYFMPTPQCTGIINLAKEMDARYIVNKGPWAIDGWAAIHEKAKADAYLFMLGDSPLAYDGMVDRLLDLLGQYTTVLSSAEDTGVFRQCGIVNVYTAEELEFRIANCDTDALRGRPELLYLEKPDLLARGDPAVFPYTKQELMYGQSGGYHLRLEYQIDGFVLGELFADLYDGKPIDTLVAIDWCKAHPEIAKYNRWIVDGLIDLKSERARSAMRRLEHQIAAAKDDRSKLQRCERCELYLGYIREERGRHRFYLPDGTILEGTGKVTCSRCGEIRSWWEDR